jgi:hypothetical protein
VRKCLAKDPDERWQAIMGVTIRPSPSFSATTPRVLFRRALRVAPLYPYDVAPDGKFLAIQPLPPPILGPMTIVLNWFDEVKAKAPNRQSALPAAPKSRSDEGGTNVSRN